MAKVTVARLEAEEDQFIDCFGLLLDLAEEIGYAPVDQDKAAADVYRTLESGLAWVARDQDGKALGVLGLVECEWWFSRLTFLTSKWFYVRPEHRFGRVGVALMRAASKEARARKLPVFVTTNNPLRRPKQSWATEIAQAAGYIPAGYRFNLTGGARNVRSIRRHDGDGTAGH